MKTFFLKINQLFYTEIASLAVSIQNETLLRLALAHKANPNAFLGMQRLKGKHGKRLLHEAVSKNWIPGVQLILSAGADTEIRGGKPEATPFFLSVFNRSPTAETLAYYGADPNGKGYGYNLIDEAKVLDVVGWDYPSQAALIVCREKTTEELAKGGPHEYLIKMARERHLEKQLNASTNNAKSQRKTTRL